MILLRFTWYIGTLIEKNASVGCLLDSRNDDSCAICYNAFAMPSQTIRVINNAVRSWLVLRSQICVQFGFDYATMFNTKLFIWINTLSELWDYKLQNYSNKDIKLYMNYKNPIAMYCDKYRFAFKWSKV